MNVCTDLQNEKDNFACKENINSAVRVEAKMETVQSEKEISLVDICLDGSYVKSQVHFVDDKIIHVYSTVKTLKNVRKKKYCLLNLEPRSFYFSVQPALTIVKKQTNHNLHYKDYRERQENLTTYCLDTYYHEQWINMSRLCFMISDFERLFSGRNGTEKETFIDVSKKKCLEQFCREHRITGEEMVPYLKKQMIWVTKVFLNHIFCVEELDLSYFLEKYENNYIKQSEMDLFYFNRIGTMQNVLTQISALIMELFWIKFHLKSILHLFGDPMEHSVFSISTLLDYVHKNHDPCLYNEHISLFSKDQYYAYTCISIMIYSFYLTTHDPNEYNEYNLPILEEYVRILSFILKPLPYTGYYKIVLYSFIGFMFQCYKIYFYIIQSFYHYYFIMIQKWIQTNKKLKPTKDCTLLDICKQQELCTPWKCYEHEAKICVDFNSNRIIEIKKKVDNIAMAFENRIEVLISLINKLKRKILIDLEKLQKVESYVQRKIRNHRSTSITNKKKSFLQVYFSKVYIMRKRICKVTFLYERMRKLILENIIQEIHHKSEELYEFHKRNKIEFLKNIEKVIEIKNQSLQDCPFHLSENSTFPLIFNNEKLFDRFTIGAAMKDLKTLNKDFALYYFVKNNETFLKSRNFERNQSIKTLFHKEMYTLKPMRCVNKELETICIHKISKYKTREENNSIYLERQVKSLVQERVEAEKCVDSLLTRIPIETEPSCNCAVQNKKKEEIKIRQQSSANDSISKYHLLRVVQVDGKKTKFTIKISLNAKSRSCTKPMKDQSILQFFKKKIYKESNKMRLTQKYPTLANRGYLEESYHVGNKNDMSANIIHPINNRNRNPKRLINSLITCYFERKESFPVQHKRIQIKKMLKRKDTVITSYFLPKKRIQRDSTESNIQLIETSQKNEELKILSCIHKKQMIQDSLNKSLVKRNVNLDQTNHTKSYLSLENEMIYNDFNEHYVRPCKRKASYLEDTNYENHSQNRIHRNERRRRRKTMNIFYKRKKPRLLHSIYDMIVICLDKNKEEISNECNTTFPKKKSKKVNWNSIISTEYQYVKM